MVKIRVVGVRVSQPRMPVRMRVRLAAVPRGVVLMLMMRVVHMLMGVLQLVMHVCMRVVLREMQRYAECHESAGQPEHGSGALGQDSERFFFTGDGRHREICAGP